jgi:hypothetical protein
MWKRAFWACFRENWVYKFGHGFESRSGTLEEGPFESPQYGKNKQKAPFVLVSSLLFFYSICFLFIFYYVQLFFSNWEMFLFAATGRCRIWGGAGPGSLLLPWRSAICLPAPVLPGTIINHFYEDIHVLCSSRCLFSLMETRKGRISRDETF